MLTVAAVLAIGRCAIAEFLLNVDNVLDFLGFHLGELSLGNLALLLSSLGVQKLLGTKKRAQVLGAERRSLVKLRSHCGETMRSRG